MSASKRGSKAVTIGDSVRVKPRKAYGHFIESAWTGKVVRIEGSLVWLDRKGTNMAGVQPVSLDRLK